MWKWLAVFALVLLAIFLMPTSVLADSSADVTVTATGYVCGVPGGLTLTYISDGEVGISWTKGTDADNTMVRAKYGSAPTSRTDGYLIYYGTGTSASDTGVTIEETATQIYYRAWSQNASGYWEETGTSNFFEGGGMTLIALFLLGGIFSYLAFRSNFLMLKFLASVGWIAIFIYWVTNPPAAITAGSPAHVAIMLALIAAAVIIPIMGAGQRVQRTEMGEGFSETSEKSRLRLPDWMRGEEAKEAARRRSSQFYESEEEHRERVQRALRTGRYNRRRR